MTPFDRRSVLKLAFAAAPAVLWRDAGAAAGTPLDTAALVAAWQRLFAGPPGRPFAWWYAGTLYAHVDGLREFPVVALNAIMICETSVTAAATVVDWRTLGYFSDLERGAPAAHWDNVFTGARCSIPPRFAEGPGQYRLTTAAGALALQARNVRTNRASLTGNATADGLLLTQIEGTLQGLPRLDGTLPPLDSPDLTERQTRLELVSRDDPSSRTAPLVSGARGFFNHVYDALPDWLGFGSRLGSALSKGVMRKARADEVVDPAVWSALRQLFPDEFRRGELRLRR